STPSARRSRGWWPTSRPGSPATRSTSTPAGTRSLSWPPPRPPPPRGRPCGSPGADGRDHVAADDLQRLDVVDARHRADRRAEPEVGQPPQVGQHGVDPLALGPDIRYVVGG